MSTPAPTPTPEKKRNPLLIGCLVILVLLVLGAGAVMLLGLYAAKRGLEAVGPEAQKAYEQAQAAAAAMQVQAQQASMAAQAMESQARLAMATHAVATAETVSALPCPPDPARVSVPVDAEWFRALAGGVPRERIGTPWMRHRVFTNLAEQPFDAQAGEDKIAMASVAADRDLSDAGTIAVIHTTKLAMPVRQAVGKVDAGRFEGYVQLVKYPSGDSLCLVPFSADSPDKLGAGNSAGLRARGLNLPPAGRRTPQEQVEDDFQGRFWAAEEAALGK